MHIAPNPAAQGIRKVCVAMGKEAIHWAFFSFLPTMDVTAAESWRCAKRMSSPSLMALSKRAAAPTSVRSRPRQMRTFSWPYSQRQKKESRSYNVYVKPRYKPETNHIHEAVAASVADKLHAVLTVWPMSITVLLSGTARKDGLTITVRTMLFEKRSADDDSRFEWYNEDNPERWFLSYFLICQNRNKINSRNWCFY